MYIGMSVLIITNALAAQSTLSSFTLRMVTSCTISYHRSPILEPTHMAVLRSLTAFDSHYNSPKHAVRLMMDH